MNWETIEITKPIRKTEAFASIGRNAIALSGGACSLISNYPKYSHVQLLRGRIDGKKVLGIRFLESKEKNSLELKRRKSKGEPIAFSGLIYNKTIMEELFGIIGTQNKVTNYSVTLDEEAKNVLVIHLDN